MIYQGRYGTGTYKERCWEWRSEPGVGSGVVWVDWWVGVQWGGREGAGCVWSTGVGLGVQLVNLNVIRAHDGAILPPLSKCGTERSYNTHKKMIVSYSFTHTPHIHWSFVVYNYEQKTNSVLEEARILFLNPRQPHIPSQRPRHTLPPSSLRSYHPTVHSTTNPPRPPTARVLPPGDVLVRTVP